MRYNIRINKRVKNTRVYAITKRVEGNPNIVTKFFMKIFVRKKHEAY